MSSSDTSASLRFDRPICLRPDNFTPLTRTPWAGDALARLYKQDLVPAARGQKIGESWEFSCDSLYPSVALASGVPLPELISKYPREILGGDQHRCEILVKLLNAGEPLSVQVHPRDDDPDLRPGECGKPESWYVLHAEPGAGIYLGFSRPISHEVLRAALLEGEQARDLLQFVPVQAGDYFEIEPGVPHCVGAGLTLLEPQRVLQGQAGKTYRLWDFGRLYDLEGRVDERHGKPRPLHLEEGLKLVSPSTQTGAEWLAKLRRTPEKISPAPGVTVLAFPANNWYRTVVLDAVTAAEFPLRLSGGYASFTVLSGEMTAQGVSMPAGQSALIPAAAWPLTLKVAAGSKAALVFPVHCEFGV